MTLVVRTYLVFKFTNQQDIGAAIHEQLQANNGDL